MSLQRMNKPAGKPVPYLIAQNEGETLAIPGTRSAIRILASTKETNGKLSVFKMDGVTGDPAGFHYHNEAHDVFMCTRGFIQVWAGDKARTLGAGDFAYVPPKVVHQPKIVGPWTETVGLVTPGDWIDFFRFIAEPYNGILSDESDMRDTKEIIFPKIMGARDKNFDVVFQPQHQGCDIGDWDETDTIIPEGVQPYFLRADTGPKYLLGGLLSRPFITPRQNGGQFAISSIESSSRYSPSILSQPFSFSKVHHLFHVLDGILLITVGEKEETAVQGETVFLPAGTKFSLAFGSKLVRFWSFANGNGIEAMIQEAGSTFNHAIIPDVAAPVEQDKVSQAAERFDVHFY